MFIATIIDDCFRAASCIAIVLLILMAWTEIKRLGVALCITITLGYTSGLIAIVRHFGQPVHWWRSPLLFIGAVITIFWFAKQWYERYNNGAASR